MATSVKYDGTEILNTTYIPRFVQHESAPERSFGMVNVVGEDGAVLVFDQRGVKRIKLQGILTGTTETKLEENIDSFKELFARKNKNLDIYFAGATRRYVANCSYHNFSRDHFHLLFVPWTAEFLVMSGAGEDITLTNILSKSFNSLSVLEEKINFGGSAGPKPIWKINPSSDTNNIKGLSIKNADTGRRIVIIYPNGFNVLAPTGNFMYVDECEKRVYTLINDVEVDLGFYGTFPGWIPGDNNVEIEAGGITDQEYVSDTHTGGKLIHSNKWVAQKFSVPYSDNTYQMVSLFLATAGSPPNVLKVEVREDDDNTPNGSVIASGSIGAISVSYGWNNISFASAFNLESGKSYWILLKTVDGDRYNSYSWAISEEGDPLYARGYSAYSANGGIDWTIYPLRNHWFKLRYGGLKMDKTITVYCDYHKRYL